MMANGAIDCSGFSGGVFPKCCDYLELICWAVNKVPISEMFFKIRSRRISAIVVKGAGPRSPVMLRNMSPPLAPPLKVGVVLETLLEEASVGAKVAENVASGSEVRLVARRQVGEY